MSNYITPDEVDTWLQLPRGKAARMARRGKIPAVLLPDGSIRFCLHELEEFLKAKRVDGKAVNRG